MATQNGQKHPVLKITEAMGIRSQIALAIAEHDAELALAFVADSSKVISDEKFKQRYAGNDARLEDQIIAVMSAQNVDNALKIGRKKLAKGFSHSLFSLAQKIYKKDLEKGREFADEDCKQNQSGWNGRRILSAN